MKRRGRLSFAVLATTVAALAAAPGASAGLEALDLKVIGGADTWHSRPDFGLEWKPVKGSILGDIGSDDDVVYRVRDEQGQEVGQGRASSQETSVGPFQIASAKPGIYKAEAWLENPFSTGPVRTVSLRFDDRRPAPARAVTPGWVRGNASVVLEIEHPATPQPLAGIRGYAVSVTQGAAAPPCLDPDRCSESEIDLPAGIDDDTISLGVLPEGPNVASVLAVSGSGMHSAVAEQTTFQVDATRPDIDLSGVRNDWVRGPVEVTAGATDHQSGMTAAGPTGPFTAISVDGGPRTIFPGRTATATVVGEGTHLVAAFARDAVGNLREADEMHPAPSAIVRIDETAPRLEFSKVQDPGDPERILAFVSDTLSGPDGATGTIALRPTGSQRAFEAIPTSVSGNRLSGRWDSDAYSPGSYEFRATGADAVGNRGSTGQRSDGTRMVLANPLKAATSIQFGFGGKQLVWQRCTRSAAGRRCHREVLAPFDRRPGSRVVPYGHGIRIGGRMLSATGAPLAGLEVNVTEAFDPGAAIARRVTTVVTGTDGLFSARLLPGPNRQVEAGFAGNRLLARVASRSLRLDVQTAVRLRASSAAAAIGGAPVIFSGRVGNLDAKIPSFGRPVQLQFRLSGMPWTEFRTVQTDAHGRFHYPYAFTDDDSRGVRFQFRAYAPPQPNWPYAPAASLPVAVTGN